MKRTAFGYVRFGQKKAKAFAKRSFGNRVVSTLHQLASLLSYFTFFLTPIFTTSNYSYCYMLNESDDAIITKSFDSAENSKVYLTTLALMVIDLGAVLAALGLSSAIFFPVQMALAYTVVNPFEVMIYTILVAIVSFLPSVVVAIWALLYFQAGTYLLNKNKAMGTGDILYNAGRFVKSKGGTLFLIDLIYILLGLLIIGIFFGGGTGLLMLGRNSYQFFKPLFVSLGYSVFSLFGVLFVFFGGQFFSAWRVSAFALLEEEAKATKYVVVYPSKQAGDAVTTKGKFIEIVSLEDEEVHPLENASVEDEDPVE